MHKLVHDEAMSSPLNPLATSAVFWTEEEPKGALDVLFAS